MKAILITPTDIPKLVEVRSYEEIRSIIGGWLECIRIGNDAIAYIDEEGKIKKDSPPINRIATIVANIPTDYIRGPMLIVGNGNETDVPQRLIDLLINHFTLV